MFVWWLYIHRAGIITRCLTSLNLLRPFKPIISFNKISVLELPVLRVGWNIFRYSEQIEDQHLYTCIEIIVLHFISHLHDFIEFPVTKTALELYSPLRQACQTWFSTECLQEGNILSVVVETRLVNRVESWDDNGDNAWSLPGALIDQNYGSLPGRGWRFWECLIMRELRWELRDTSHPTQHHSLSLYRKCSLCAGAGRDLITVQTPRDHTPRMILLLHWRRVGSQPFSLIGKSSDRTINSAELASIHTMTGWHVIGG